MLIPQSECNIIRMKILTILLFGKQIQEMADIRALLK